MREYLPHDNQIIEQLKAKLVDCGLDENGARNINLNIFAERGAMVSLMGKVVKHVHPALVGGILVFAFAGMYLNTSVSKAQGAYVSELVGAVAKCESVHPQKIHAELHRRYNYRGQEDMNQVDYQLAKMYLKSRRCDVVAK